jgi:NAD-dependent deacetylase
MDKAELDEAANWLRSASEIVVFTGAGISAESGIPTFRDDSGLWLRFPPEQFANWVGLTRVARSDPRRFAEFLHAVLAPIAAAKPNAAHLALAKAERHASITIVTQNVDGLHQAAGSTIVHEIHGSFFEVVTLSGRFCSLLSRRELAKVAASIDRLQKGWLVLPRLALAARPLAGLGWRGVYHPKLVLFGDTLAEPAWRLANEATRNCELFLQIGCSGVVYPAAMLPDAARRNGARVIAVDPAPVNADLWLRGSAAKVLPELFRLARRAG